MFSTILLNSSPITSKLSALLAAVDPASAAGLLVVVVVVAEVVVLVEVLVLEVEDAAVVVVLLLSCTYYNKNYRLYSQAICTSVKKLTDQLLVEDLINSTCRFTHSCRYMNISR